MEDQSWLMLTPQKASRWLYVPLRGAKRCKYTEDMYLQVLAGVKSIEHGSFIDDECIQLMKVIPT